MEKELSLLEVYNWAIRLKDWTEFKSAIDEFYNGTPRSVTDESTYKLVKNNGVLDDVINCEKCGGEVLYDEEYKSTFCNRCYQS